ncbi:MAG TPA: FkbM family methyltransferase [Alphaproteobacteria bacterium]|nr:FkbM family methyltransferase [Alphaproteobacteria bacterium]
MTDQILQFLAPDVKLTRTRYGLMVYPANDLFIGPCLEAYGEYGPEEGNSFRQIVRPGDVVADIGANIGSHTLLFSELVGPGGHVLAFEPQRKIFHMLCANLALNAIANVATYQNGVGREPGTLMVSSPGPEEMVNFGGVSLGEQGNEAVGIVTLDGLGLERLDFVKIDVEGMEESVIRGGLETIKRLKPKLYVENDGGADKIEISASLIRTIRDLGYRLWWHVAPLYQPGNFRGHNRNIFRQNIVSVSMLCIHSDEPVETNFDEIRDDRSVPVL